MAVAQQGRTCFRYPAEFHDIGSLLIVLEHNMHVRWRGLELPATIETDDRSRSQTFGRFIVEPFERGFGTTIGNSLRRILLSSIEGAAVVKAQIEGVQHEYSTRPGVMEDVTDIIINI